MNITQNHVALLMELGNPEPEARFLYVVVTHSGYFILRQFLNFTGARRGKRSNQFARKVFNNGHGSVRDHLGYGSIYHLFSRTLYGQFEKGNLRKHSFEYIRTRLVLLDFILANPEAEYLETEQDKVTFFCEKLGVAMLNLANRDAGAMVEEPLMHLGQSAAIAYASTTSVDEHAWPTELRDPNRREIDRTVLRLLGIPEPEIEPVRVQIINDLIGYTRKLRLLELEAQINRHGSSGGSGPSPRILADEIWTQLINSTKLTLRPVPHDFLPASFRGRNVQLPVGRLTIAEPGLFDPERKYEARTDSTVVFRGSQEEVMYISALAKHGVSGEVIVPAGPEVCQRAAESIEVYYQEFSHLFQLSIEEITSDIDLQRRIIREGWKRVISDARRQ